MAHLAPAAIAYFGIKGVSDMLAGPELPKMPEPEAPVESGSEGIRSGEMARKTKRRAIGSLYLTQGQQRQGETLASAKQTLG